MDWDRIQASWKQLIEKVAFHRGRRRRGDRNSVDLIGAASSTESSSADTQTTPLRSHDHSRRSEFSLHIGC